MVFLILCHQPSTVAQVTPDGTLSTTVSSSDNLNFLIEGGDRAGNNLFHSVETFSVPTNGSAVFNNATDLRTIITRVTGHQRSRIDGVLKTNGRADLFLINPRGIVFGENAQLNVGGSLITSTADSIQFADGTEFSAINPANPLLTITAPIGLQLGQSPGAIDVRGMGKDGTFPASTLGLEIPSGETIALIGGNVTVRGGVVTAKSGRIEVGSGAEGRVGLTSIPVGWAMDYSEVQSFGEITLGEQSSLWTPNITANPTGGIQVVGHNIQLNRSQLASATLGHRIGGDITVFASGTLTLAEDDLTQFPYSAWIINQVDRDATGQGGSIAITANNLTIQDGARIQTLSEGSGDAGAIAIAAETVAVDGFSALGANPLLVLLNLNSRISSEAQAAGNTGDINIEAHQIDLTAGGQINTVLHSTATGESGHISVVAKDQITIAGENPASQLLLSGIGQQSFGPADLDLIDVSATSLRLEEGGVILMLNLGTGRGGRIDVDVADDLRARGNNLDTTVASGITSVTAGLAPGASIDIEAASLTIEDGANILTTALLNLGDAFTFPTEGRTGKAGDIDITATDFIHVAGGNALEERRLSVILSNTFIPANTGSVTIQSPILRVQDGASLGTTVLLPLPTVATDEDIAIVGRGNGGDVVVNADYMEVSGTDTTGLVGSTLGNLTTGAGNAGNTTINTRELVVSDRGAVNSVTSASGDAGQLIINASESITVRQSLVGEDTAGITANAIRANDPSIQALFSLPDRPSGNTGALQINTPRLDILDNGRVSVQHEGTGNAGKLDIQADTIVLDNHGQLTVETLGGKGGNLVLQVQDVLAFQNRSVVSAESQGQGDGGNITIDAAFVVGLDNSDMIANAVEGNGGRIFINTQGLFGLTFRDRLTSDNDITATSQFGLDGTVEINSPDADPSSQGLELPDTLVDVSQLVRPGCSLDEDQFVLAGRGGLPSSPMELVDGDRPWFDLRDPFTQSREGVAHAEPAEQPTAIEPLQEATGMAFVEHSLRLIGPNGPLQLTAPYSQHPITPHPTCTSHPNIS